MPSWTASLPVADRWISSPSRILRALCGVAGSSVLSACDYVNIPLMLLFVKVIGANKNHAPCPFVALDHHGRW
jgi:hypothetical protein